MQKSEHILLADYSHFFTSQWLAYAVKCLDDPELEKPRFMRKVPGIFSKGTDEYPLDYTDTLGVKRKIVPAEWIESTLRRMWKDPRVPRGQESFSNKLYKIFIGIPQKQIREFVAQQHGVQMVRDLNNSEPSRRAVRAMKPFQNISVDLADMISFSEHRGKEEDRFVFLCACDFSGFLFGHKILSKGGRDTTHVMRSILEKIKRLGGKPVNLTSDSGLEFFNHFFQDLLTEYHIRHRKPKRVRIAPFIENRVKVFKRYVRLNSKLLYKDVNWWDPGVISNSIQAVNGIQRKEGYTAHEIIERWQQNKSLLDVRMGYRNANAKPKKTQIGYSTLSNGDWVRIRIAKQKLSMTHKTHLGYHGDDFTKPVSWSKETYRVIKKKQLRVRRTMRYQLNNKDWYYRAELLKIPSGNNFKVARMTI